MKKLGIVILILFSLFAIVFAVMQTDAGKNIVARRVVKELKDIGVEATVGSVSGTFPTHVILKNVTVQGGLTVESLQGKIEVWRLIKQEIGLTFEAKNIAFKDFKGDAEGELHISKKSGYIHATLHEAGRDWKLSSNFTHTPTAITLAPFSLTGELVTVQGTAHLNGAFQVVDANVHIQTKYGAGNVQLEHGNEITFAGEILNVPLQGKMEVVFENGSVFLRNWKLSSQYATANGNLEIRPDLLFIGNVEWTIDNLQSLKIPDVYGSSKGKVTLNVADGKQTAHFDAAASDFHYGPLYAAKATLYSDLVLPDSGHVDIELERARYKDVHLELATLDANLNGPWKLFAEGRWKHPLELNANGTWNQNQLRVEDINGAVFNYSVALLKPVEITWTKDVFQMPELELAIAKSTAIVHIDHKGAKTEATLKLENVPIELLSLNELDLPIPGTINLDASLTEENEDLKGQFKATVAEKQFEGEVFKDRLEMKGKGNNLDFNLSVPIHLSLFPFKAELQLHQSIKGGLRISSTFSIWATIG
jgi:hypothetical protein